MTRRTRIRLQLVLAATLLTVSTTGCATSSPGSNRTSVAHSSDSNVSGATSTAKPGTGAGRPVNALDLTGPTVVRDVAPVEAPARASKPELPATVTDSRGTKVTITSAKRVIVLDLYATLSDTMIGLGLSDRLVGRAGSDTQPSLARLPVVSKDGLELNTEAVLDLRPDLILTNLTIGTERVYAQLESAGITVVRFPEVPSIDKISESIHAVGAVFGLTEPADALAKRTATALTRAQATIKTLQAATPRKPRAIVLYVRGHSGIFFIFGPDYGAAQVLDKLGLKDVAGDSGITDLAPANAESLVSLDPEIILTMKDGVDSTGGVDGLLARPGLAETTAGRHKRLIMAADNQLLSYGPRTPANLVALATAIYTDESNS